jgi:NADH:ubiquinone oxidoreductase subunit 3 (subunit A)
MDTTAPSASFLAAHSGILVFLLIGIGFLAVNLVLWRVIRPSRFSEEKLTTYECGENPTGSAWIQFNIRFYVFALIFIIFDVEAVFLLPWAVVFRKLGEEQGLLPFVEGLVFIAILVVALAYVWRKGDLEWVRAEDKA